VSFDNLDDIDFAVVIRLSHPPWKTSSNFPKEGGDLLDCCSSFYFGNRLCTLGLFELLLQAHRDGLRALSRFQEWYQGA